MNPIVYCIPGDPVALARPRLVRDHVWDCQKQLKFAAGIQVRNQHGDQPLFTGPLHITITFFMPIAKSSPKMLNGKYHVYKPDLDNMVKFICDICNEILYKDDCIISEITAKKVYSTVPRTEFTIIPL